MLKATKIPPAILGVVAVVLLAAVAFFSQSNTLLATPSLTTAFVARYPDTRETKLNNCATCHMPAIEGFLNGYGLALKEAKMDFEAIEEIDSDEDGVSNIDEIKDERYPGSHATYAEYFIFHVDFSKEDPELGKVHFNHEMHTIKESFLSKGRCANCHGKDLFPKIFNDKESVRPVAHQICWRCHETSGSKLAPTDCTSCHTGIKDILDDIKELLK